MPPSRSLTASFLKYRQEQKQKKNRFGYSLLKVAESEDVYHLGKGKAGEIELLPIGQPAVRDWSSSVKEAKLDMEKIKERLTVLQKIQQRRLLKVFDDASGVETLGDAEIDAVGQEIMRLFRSCEKRIKEIERFPGADGKEEELKKNAQRGLAGRLQGLNEEVRTCQKQFMREVKRRQQMASFGETSETNTGGTSLLDAALTEHQTAALESMEAEAEMRSQEINKIAKSVADLNRVFKELATLVIEQGTLLDRIDYNVENVQDNTKQATVQLQQADEEQKSGTAKQCIIILIVLIVVNLLFWAFRK